MNRRRILQWFAVLGVAGSLIGLPAASTATVLTPPCSIATLTVYEDVSWSGDSKTFCYGTNISHLGNVAHTQSGVCSSVFFRIGDHWDDCISSAIYHENLAYGNPTACLWTNSFYGGNSVRFVSDGAAGSWSTGIYADSFTSLSWNC
jgi:hypothetical protein